MNHQFPVVKTYSTKWQRSYRLYQDSDKLFDNVQRSTSSYKSGKTKRSESQSLSDQREMNTQRSRMSSREGTKSQGIQKSPKRITRPVSVNTLTKRGPTSPCAGTSNAVPRPSTVIGRKVQSSTNSNVQGSPMITKPLRRYGVPSVMKTEPRRPPSSSVTASSSSEINTNRPNTLCTANLLKYRPEHAEKAYFKNDSYIHAWLRGVEEAQARARREREDEYGIEMLRDAQTECPALTRKNSAIRLLKDMKAAFETSSFENSPELSKDQPSLPEIPKSAATDKECRSQSCPSSAKRKSLIPRLTSLSKHRDSLTDSHGCDDSTPIMTRTDDNSSNTYTYKWTLGSTTQQDKTSKSSIQRGKIVPESPVLCMSKLRLKRLNSTTRPKAKSLEKVEFSQYLSPIVNNAEEMQRSAESTPETNRKRSSGNKENIIPHKQRCIGDKKGKLAPKTSTRLFASQTINLSLSSDLSSIQLGKGMPQSPVTPNQNRAQKSFDFEVGDDKKETAMKQKQIEPDDLKDILPKLGPVITSTPDSQHKFIRAELMILADLSSVAPPSAADDELLPLRTSGYEVNSDEIMCASDLDFEVDMPQINDLIGPNIDEERNKQGKERLTSAGNSSSDNDAHKTATTKDSTSTLVPSISTITRQDTPDSLPPTKQKSKSPKQNISGNEKMGKGKQFVSTIEKQSKPDEDIVFSKPSNPIKGKGKTKRIKTDNVSKVDSPDTGKSDICHKYKTTNLKSSLSCGNQSSVKKTVQSAIKKRDETKSLLTANKSKMDESATDSNNSATFPWKFHSRSAQSTPCIRVKVVEPLRSRSTNIPICSLVQAQRHNFTSGKRSKRMMTIKPMTQKLMKELKKAPEDSIMVSARRLSRMKGKAES